MIDLENLSEAIRNAVRAIEGPGFEARLARLDIPSIIRAGLEQDRACSQVHPDSALPSVPVERRRDLATAKLPLDVECALEHVAIVMNQAHQRLTDVLRKHLPSEDSRGR